MSGIKKFIMAVGASIFSILAIFFYGVTQGKRKKESQILKEGVKDAMATKKRESRRRNDNIDDIIKRVRRNANK